jgi:hypothetical protein
VAQHYFALISISPMFSKETFRDIGQKSYKAAHALDGTFLFAASESGQRIRNGADAAGGLLKVQPSPEEIHL